MTLCDLYVRVHCCMSERRASNKITTLVFHRKAHPSKVKMAHSVNSVTSRDKLGRVGGYDSLPFKMHTKFSCERL